MLVVIVDYQTANLGSVVNMLRRIGAEALISSKVSDVERAEKIILPGIGSFDKGMASLHKLGIITALNKRILENKVPVLGICLGMQMFSESSQEGSASGLGWLKAKAVKFSFNEKLRLPHMQWNALNLKQAVSLFDNMYENSRFYFAHSYHLVCQEESNVVSTTRYGYDFASSVKKDNIFGVQFHPEKSLKFGMRVLENFVKLI